MYSIDLFIVDTSLSGFLGSGDTDVRGRQNARNKFVRRPPGELHHPRQPQLVTQRHELVETVSRADQREADVVTAEFTDDDVGGP